MSVHTQACDLPMAERSATSSLSEIAKGLRVGIVGTRWGRVHLAALRHLDATIVGLCGRDRRRTEELCRTHGIALATTKLDELCRASDIVIIASADRDHFDHALQAMELGCHVLVEKSLAWTFDQCLELIACAKRSGRFAAVNFQHRSNPRTARLAEFMKQHPYRWCSFEARGFWVPKTAIGTESTHCVLDERTADYWGISHIIDLALVYAGSKPVSIRSWLVGSPAYVADIMIEMENGARASVRHGPSVLPGEIAREARYHGRMSPDEAQTWSAVSGVFYSDDTPLESSTRIFVDELEVPYGAQPDIEFRVADDLLGDLRKAYSTYFDFVLPCQIETSARYLESIARGAPDSRLASFEDAARVQQLIEAALVGEQSGAKVLIADLSAVK